jgi:hypothetical protein
MGSRAPGAAFKLRDAFLIVAACAPLGLGCMEPLQSGGVMIVGDPGERIAAMCRFRHRDRVGELCGGDASGAASAGATEGAETAEDEDIAPGEERADSQPQAPATAR